MKIASKVPCSYNKKNSNEASMLFAKQANYCYLVLEIETGGMTVR